MGFGGGKGKVWKAEQGLHKCRGRKKRERGEWDVQRQGPWVGKTRLRGELAGDKGQDR